eukprot:m.16527 g.16527  ORF g.16527 m.16527 type:complete len:60 (-) comp7103_c0_seq1:145-324(-)
MSLSLVCFDRVYPLAIPLSLSLYATSTSLPFHGVLCLRLLLFVFVHSGRTSCCIVIVPY